MTEKLSIDSLFHGINFMQWMHLELNAELIYNVWAHNKKTAAHLIQKWKDYPNDIFAWYNGLDHICAVELQDYYVKGMNMEMALIE